MADAEWELITLLLHFLNIKLNRYNMKQHLDLEQFA